MTRQITAWWWDGALRFGQRPRPARVAPDDVRVRVVLAGVCRTDVAVARGHLACAAPCVLGHEVAGVVESVGPAVQTLRPGDRVACHPSVDGAQLGVHRDGGFADELVVPARALVRVPDTLDWRRAAFVEPVAACLAVTRAPLSSPVRVIGEGRIAELTRRCLRAVGVDETSAPADTVIETGGTADSLATALRSVHDGGLVVLKSRPASAIAVDVTAVVQRELRLHGVGWAPFDEAIALLAGPLDVDDLLGEVLPLAAFGDLLDADESRKRFVAPDPSLCAG